MLRVVLLCLILTGMVRSNWDENTDLASADLGFAMLNMTCNDAKSSCQHCFTFYAYGRQYMYVLEYTLDPFTLHLAAVTANREWHQILTQEDQYAPFRQCSEEQRLLDFDLGEDFKWAYCSQNDFSVITVPAECTNPVMLISLDGHLRAKKVRGFQLLYCGPAK